MLSYNDIQMITENPPLVISLLLSLAVGAVYCPQAPMALRSWCRHRFPSDFGLGVGWGTWLVTSAPDGLPLAPVANLLLIKLMPALPWETFVRQHVNLSSWPAYSPSTFNIRKVSPKRNKINWYQKQLLEHSTWIFISSMEKGKG